MKRWIVMMLMLGWLGWHLAKPVDFVRSDLGRHIKNGELILQGTADVLYKNYYSFTNPQYPFINHHWLFGVFCYSIWHLVSFSGLSLIYVLLELLTFYLFLYRAERLSNLTLACAFGLMSFPLLATRAEIRPEGFSMLFCGLFWLLMNSYQEGRMKAKHLTIVLACAQIAWVNLHCFFPMGPFLAALFYVHSRINHQQETAKTFKAIGGILVAACLVNPSGLGGALLPFDVFKGFGVDLFELQSVLVLMKMPATKMFGYYFFVIAGLVIVPWLFLIVKEGLRKNFLNIVLLLLALIASFKMIRILSLWGLFMIPLAAYAWGQCLKDWPKRFQDAALLILVTGGIAASVLINFNQLQEPSFGLKPGANNSAVFFKLARLPGPIFNNYDIGGYLIFHLSPKEKLFVDNRREAFPKDFFEKVYVKMMMDDAYWQKMQEQYHVNVIYFSRYVQTDYLAKFLSVRLADPSWAVVYMDEYAIIFLKRNAKNEGFIRYFQAHPVIA